MFMMVKMQFSPLRSTDLSHPSPWHGSSSRAVQPAHSPRLQLAPAQSPAHPSPTVAPPAPQLERRSPVPLSAYLVQSPVGAVVCEVLLVREPPITHALSSNACAPCHGGAFSLGLAASAPARSSWDCTTRWRAVISHDERQGLHEIEPTTMVD